MLLMATFSKVGKHEIATVHWKTLLCENATKIKHVAYVIHFLKRITQILNTMNGRTDGREAKTGDRVIVCKM